MKQNTFIITTLLWSSLILISCSDDDSGDDTQGIIATDAQLVNYGTGYSFTEGPAVDKSGNVFFTDQPNDIIYKWDDLSWKRQVAPMEWPSIKTAT
jgi:gluconolactonase